MDEMSNCSSHRGCGRPGRSLCSFSVCLFALCAWLLSSPSRISAADSEACLECHSDPELVRETDYRTGTPVFVDPEQLARSVHADMDCVDCHTEASEDHPPRMEPVDCADCHDDEAGEYAASLHGQALARGEEDAPGCSDCHGTHQILPADDPESTVHPRKIPYTCAACHADVDFIKRRPVSLGSPLEAYQSSEHFKALMAGKGGATCTDCHSAHALYKPCDPRSQVYRTNVPRTCGQCHGEIQREYEQSIHGKALAFGSTDAPTCVDCHGEHRILGPKDPESTVYPAHISRTTCVWCHDSERIADRYGLPAKRLSTYIDSYHGLAERSGSTTVANCASCHGVHDILPSSDPKSTIYPDNLPKTCGQCHPGAGEKFSIGPVHVAPDVQEHPIVRLVRRFYILLIVGTIGFMGLHNGLDFFKNFKAERLPYGRDYLRFSLSERIQHGVMALSFIALAYSGFALKFPDAWWTFPLDWINGGEEMRRLIHRIAAVAMVGICFFHVAYVLASRRGRDQFAAMLPRIKDLSDFLQRIRYYLGWSPQPPAFARFSYGEKIEYWALVWGSVVMAGTGFLLWFENLSLRFLPKWGLDLATTIHYYEAWLATLAIVVWHFYWVIFHPRIYPMSLVWLTGRMSEEEMEHEHPLELERLRSERGNKDQGES